MHTVNRRIVDLLVKEGIGTLCIGKMMGGSKGRTINADINGAGNIMRKVVPNAFGSEEIEDGNAMALVVHPVKFVVVPSQTQKGKSQRESNHTREW